jgi:hypothetical protein
LIYNLNTAQDKKHDSDDEKNENYSHMSTP